MGAWKGNDIVAGQRGGTAARWRRAAVAAAALAVPLAGAGIAAAPASAAGSSTAAASAATFYKGEVLISEFRLSGPRGAHDEYAELYNTGAPVSLAGFKLTASPGAHRCPPFPGLRCRRRHAMSVTIPATAPVLPKDGTYLIAGRRYSLGGVAVRDLTAADLGSTGLRLTAPDGTVTDAVGSAGAGRGFYSGTPLPALPGTATDQYAWVRVELDGQPANTGDNATDFHLVSTTGRQISGGFECRGHCAATLAARPARSRCRRDVFGVTLRAVCPALGAPTPLATGSPEQDNEYLRSALLDPAVAETAAPNTVDVPGTGLAPGRLTVRRTITNSSAITIGTAEVHITAFSELNGAPEPGVATQAPDPARLRIIDPAAPTSQVTITGPHTVTVQNLSVDTPDMALPGGGLNTTLVIPLPGGGLAPGASVSIALTFAVDQPGHYWFGYDVDALPLAHAPRAAAETPAAAAATPSGAPGNGIAPGAPSRYAGGDGILP